jgi:serine/threonine protein kinase
MNKEEIKEMIGKYINKYKIQKFIGSGAFGIVFEAINIKTEEKVALKIPVLKDNVDKQKSLMEEAKIYNKISNPEKGIANVKITQYKDKKIIVMDLLGESLEKIMEEEKKMNIEMVVIYAIQMMEIMQYIHEMGYIHRDIKPDNFVVDRKDKEKLYCIDFGLAKKYTKKNKQHIEQTETGKFCGTARYASRTAHLCLDQSRKDDMESIGYLLIYLYKGKLPWQGIKEQEKVKRYKLIGEKKMKISNEELCKSMPKEFTVYMKYIQSLDFEEEPAYDSLKRMFEKLLKRLKEY